MQLSLCEHNLLHLANTGKDQVVQEDQDQDLMVLEDQDQALMVQVDQDQEKLI